MVTRPIDANGPGGPTEDEEANKVQTSSMGRRRAPRRRDRAEAAVGGATLPGLAARALLTLAGFALLGGAASAQPSGRMLADSCAVCHGTDGRGGGLEAIAGMRKAELVEEMKELPNEPNESRLMGLIAKAFTEPELLSMAQVIQSLPKGAGDAH